MRLVTLSWIGAIAALGLALGACRAVAQADPTTASGPSSIRAFVEPDMDRLVVLETLKDASRSIWMEMYLLNDREIIEALKQARARGVDVRVMLEPLPIASGAGNKPAFKELAAAKVDVQLGNPAFKLTHSKVILVDDRIALIMTLDQTLADFVTNREYGIINTVPADVEEIKAVLEADWKRTTPSTENPNLVWSPGNARRRLLEFIDGATKSLDLEAAEMQDDEIQAHLLAAVQRGVLVRVIMSQPQTGPSVSNAGLSQLIRGGVQVRMLRVPFVNATMMVADRARAFVGSHSFSPLSIDASRELGIFVTEKKVVEGLQGTFLNDWEIGKQRQAR